jgi:hypothetical protein
MANKQLKLKDDQNCSHSSVWEIPVNELPDKASEVWGRYPNGKRGEVTPPPPQQKVRPVEPLRKSATERAARAAT